MSCPVHGGWCDCEPAPDLWRCPTCGTEYTRDVGECGQRKPFECRERVAPVIPVGSEPGTFDDPFIALGQRMDLLAFTAEKGASWEALYKQIRNEVGGQGTGQERVIPATDLRAFIESERERATDLRYGPRVRPIDRYRSLAATEQIDRLSAWLDEYTTETPSGGTG